MKKLAVLICILTVLSSCTKVTCTTETEKICTDAVIKWGGPPAADGLGWYISVDSTRGIYYIPTNLSENFKVDGLEVNACLRETNEKFNCMCPEPLKTYEITSIRKL